MPRKATPAPDNKAPAINEKVIAEEVAATNQLAAITLAAQDSTKALAVQLGYEGALTVGSLEDEIRFYQRRSVEACLELGKRLLILKQLAPHGEFMRRAELLGFSDRTANRFMQAAAKTAKSANLATLSTQVKSVSAFLELVTQDDDVLESLSELDDIDRMSTTELKAALREAKEEAEAKDQVLADKNTQLDKERAKSKKIAKLPPDESLKLLQQEASAVMNDVLGAIRGGLRQALIALNDLPEDTPAQSIFMAGLVGQAQADLTALRDEFSLPDVSNAADAQLAEEVSQWAK